MKYQSSFLIGLFTLFIITVTFAYSLTVEQTKTASYIDPVLLANTTETVSVIVTGDSTDAAAAAVERVGGQVTSRLWLIDAAGAVVDSDKLDLLAKQPGILSIVNNQTITAADSPQCPNENGDSAPCSNRPGWVSDRQEKKGTVVLPGSLGSVASILQLPDGRYVAVAKKEAVIFADASGNIEMIIDDLDFDNMESDPIVGQDGTIYFIADKINTDDKMIIYALSSNGEVLWDYEQKNLILGLALSPDYQYLYALENGSKAKMYILDALEGDLLEKAEPQTEKPGLFTTPPLVTADGTVLIQSSGKEPDKDDTRSNVLALDPSMSLEDDKAYLWRFEAEIGEAYFELDYAPLVANDLIYLFSSKDKTLFALDIATGSLVHSYNMNNSLKAQPTVGPDGTIYLPMDKQWQALNPDLSVRFVQMLDDGYMSFPVFSFNGNVVYFAAKKTVYGFDTVTGSQLWQVTLKGDIKQDLVLDHDGNIIIGSEGKDLVIITPDGRVTTRLRLDDKFNQVMSTSNPDDQMLILIGDKELVTIGYLPDQWNPELVDVQPADGDEWEIVNMVNIDIGADVVHETELMLPDNDGDLVSTPLTGAGVTIAVVDSGVYVDGHVKNLLHSDEFEVDLKDQYIGQYDFVGDGNGPHCDTDDDYNSAEGYCFYEWDKSHDTYGHGSHVAGIIWSQITDASTSVSMGVAPGANVVSVRVLGNDGNGTYEDVVQGIQWVVENQNNPDFDFPIRVLNLSLSAAPNLPYFMDPINRAVENAWANGIVVLAAAGNEGPGAQNITVPGNDPYIITVGAINSKRTPGYWADDVIPEWSSNGPTLDGFVKPDILAPGSQIVSFLNNDDENPAQLLQDHPDYSETMSLFRMNGTSMATGVASGVVALMLEADPTLTPDQVKFRLMYSAKPAITNAGDLQYSPLQQGAGRIWAPDAVLGTEFPADGLANAGLDIHSDLAHGWALLDQDGNMQFDAEGNPLLDPTQLSYHYQGPVRAVVSDDDEVIVYYLESPLDGSIVVFGAAQVSDLAWMDYEAVTNLDLEFDEAGGNGTPWVHADAWSSGSFAWSGGSFAWSGGSFAWSGGSFAWSGGSFAWSGGSFAWSGGSFAWSGGSFAWSGGSFAWSGGSFAWSGGSFAWSGNGELTALSIGANKWIDDDRPEGFTVHISDLDIESAWISNSAWQSEVTVTVRDEYQLRIENATILGSWNDGEGENAVCTTGTNGECTFFSPNQNEDQGSVTFSILSITHDTLAYVAEDNLDLDGDSDGHSIEDQRPTYRPSVHIADLDGTSSWISSSAWSAEIMMLVLDDQGNPVVNAVIEAEWKDSLFEGVFCLTDALGQCLVEIPTISDEIDKIELEINHIEHPMLYYDVDDNTDPDNDSNGENIAVEPPEYRPGMEVAFVSSTAVVLINDEWQATFTFMALDDNGEPVSDVLVEGIWKRGLSGNASCLTLLNGQCSITGIVSIEQDEIKFQITSLTHPMLVDESDDITVSIKLPQ